MTTYTVTLPSNREIVVDPTSVSSLTWAIEQVRPLTTPIHAKFAYCRTMCNLYERLYDQRRCAEVDADEASI